MADVWGADVPISMPPGLDPDVEILVAMEGWVFTANGLAHDLSSAEREAVMHPMLAPEGAPGAPRS